MSSEPRLSTLAQAAPILLLLLHWVFLVFGRRGLSIPQDGETKTEASRAKGGLILHQPIIEPDARTHFQRAE